MSHDASAAILDAVQDHASNKRPMQITAGGSKSFLGSSTTTVDVAKLSVAEHTGVINYDPTELVMTARAGTPLVDIVKTLKDAGQHLPFEPPQLPGATLGGTLACGLSGPSRAYSGAARDHVLGTRVINGRGEDLRFGGEVMKNVAGYDVSRVQIGAFGTLGVLLDVSMKVLPLPESTRTLVFEQSADDTAPMVQLARQFLPVTASALIGTHRFIRLAGSDAGVQAAAIELGGEQVPDSDAPWSGLRDWTHAFFGDARPCWRISVADHAPTLSIPADADGAPAATLYDWGGAQRWVKTSVPAEQIFQIALDAGGHATRFTQAEPGDACHQPLSGVAARLNHRLRLSFDPDGLLNPGRFHPELDA